jgi:glycosidase
MIRRFTQQFILALAVFASVFASAAADKTDVRTSTNRVIYEVFVRNFSSEGNLAGVTAQIPRLKQLGVDVVWLMPIYSPGLTDRWGTYASPYAVRDYKGIDPDYGTADDLHTLVTTAHNNGIEIWLDWVANHTSTDNAWVTSHPEYYVGGTSPQHPFNWSDVYQLNYSNSDLRAAMIDALKYWVTEFDIDGYRCDYAEGVARDFWAEARSAVNAIKDITWLAESGGEGDAALLVKETFDYNYAWAYNDALLSIGSGENVSYLAEQSYNLHYPSDAANYTGKSRMVYLSNHDVVQDKGGTEDRHFGDNLKPMTVLEFTIYGMPLIYNGQEVKYSSAAVSLAEKTPINWNGDSSMTELITKLAYLKHTEPALRTGAESGDLINHTASSSSVYVYERRNSDQSVVVMLNFGSSATTFNVTSSLPQNTFTEVFTNQTVDFASTATFTLPAHGYAVYVKDNNENLKTNEITITFVRPSSWTNTPNVHVYYYNESTGKDVTLVDSQAMTQVAGSPDTFQYVVKNPVDGYNVMFNNGGWSNGQSDGSYYEEEAGDYTYTLNSSLQVIRYSEESTDTPTPTNQITITFVRPSYWSNTPNVHLYYYDSTLNKDVALIDNQAMTKVDNSSNTYQYVLTNPVDGYTVMFNNGGWSNGQSDGGYYESVAGDYTYSLDDSKKVIRYTITTTPDDGYYLYIDNQTGWGSNLRIYGWANGEDELFGSWPGSATTSTKTIGNTTYEVLKFPDSAIGKTYNLILSNNGDNSTQLADYVVTIQSDYYITATKSGVTTAVDLVNADNNEKNEYYNMQGIRMNARDSINGIYIKKNGTTTSKVLVK